MQEKNVIAILLTFIFVTSSAILCPILLLGQDTVRPYHGFNERLEKYSNDNTGKIKSAWLPNGKQTIVDGNGYREYEMWGEIRRYCYQNGDPYGLVLFMDTTKTKINQIGYYYGEIKSGEWITFYHNGQISSTVTYNNGHVVGNKKAYYENAKLKSEIEVNDKEERIGYYKEYYESGKIKKTGQYNLVNCKQILDSAKSQIIDKEIIQTSIPVGEWNEFYENNRINRTHHFESKCSYIIKTDTLSKNVWTSFPIFTECPSGKSIEYDLQGNILSAIEYRDCKIYFESNYNKLDSNYIDYWCSTEILLKTEKNLDKLDLVLVADFLATFHKSCKNSVEYSEWSNELLFKVLYRKPDRFLELISKNSSLSRDYIIKELSSPIHDQIGLDTTIEKIKKSKIPDSDEWKSRIIKSLEIAKGKK